MGNRWKRRSRDVSITADTATTDQVTSAPSDLRRLFGSHLIVVGFFTPDYAEAASAFSKNLIEHSVSHHLYARAKVEDGWRAQIFQKPATLVRQCSHRA
jgi:hypothetical protein